MATVMVQISYVHCFMLTSIWGALAIFCTVVANALTVSLRTQKNYLETTSVAIGV